MIDLSLPQPSLELFQDSLLSVFPTEWWGVPAAVLAALGIAAFIDARTGRVPLILLFATLIGTMGAYALMKGWMGVLEHSPELLIPAAILWIINAVTVKLFHHDAFGMGDIVWSAPAAFTFGMWPVFWAWVLGACFAILWLGVQRSFEALRTRLGSSSYAGHAYVHFVPFLFIGLCLALLFGLQTL